MDCDARVETIRRLFVENQAFFHALGNSVRQQLIMLILDDERRTVRQLAQAVGLSSPTVSHHVSILKKVGLVAEHRTGRTVYYTLQVDESFDSVRQLVAEVQAIKEEYDTTTS